MDEVTAENPLAGITDWPDAVDTFTWAIVRAAEAIQNSDVVQGTETLKIPFTEEEQRENAQSLARIWPEVARLEDEKKSVTSQYKSQIEAQQAEANKLSGWVRDGFRFGGVKIATARDYRRGVLVKTRLDTGEVVMERALTADERQRAMWT